MTKAIVAVYEDGIFKPLQKIDLPEFTDCTSFALMERVEITEVFAFDEHFNQYGNFIVLPLE